MPASPDLIAIGEPMFEFNRPHGESVWREGIGGSAGESGFERDVYTSLVDLGYRVTPQVRAGAYRIDMVVDGANDTRLAIECDGDEFHGPDRWPADMQRQRILERAGWVFWRCFASTWSMRKDDVIAELMARLTSMGIEPLKALERTLSVVDARVWPPARPPEETELAGRLAADGADNVASA